MLNRDILIVIFINNERLIQAHTRYGIYTAAVELFRVHSPMFRLDPTGNSGLHVLIDKAYLETRDAMLPPSTWLWIAAAAEATNKRGMRQSIFFAACEGEIAAKPIIEIRSKSI